MSSDEVEALVDAAAAALALPISTEYRPGVLRHFALAAAMAELIDAVPLAPHDEPAVNFTPLS